MPKPHRALVAAAGAIVFMAGMALTNKMNSIDSINTSNVGHIQRQLSLALKRETNKPVPVTPITQAWLSHRGKNMPFALPERAADWCMSPGLPPLDFKACDPKLPVNRLPLIGGLTNALKMVLLGAIISYEEGRCFFIDGSDSALVIEATPSTPKLSVLQRYFEPMGLDPEDPIVKQAIAENRVETKDWTKVWAPLDQRRIFDSKHFIEYLSGTEVNGHQLKFIAITRLWRPKEFVRDNACLALENQGLNNDYMAFSVRRGDKHELEHFNYPTADEYIAAAEKAIPLRFGGVLPKIFVATDDCVVMQEFRALRPTWTFVSQCDLEEHAADSGFAYADMKHWTADDMDRHYSKFMVELLGLSIAKFVMGIVYTNVSWWVLFMRRGVLNDIQFLDEKVPHSANNW
jgi:hypothetical protein